ncbi:CoA-transferase family III domain-containing protein [Xylaria telfairii]|nr:CoA-transferase family III domain-containing protein [Xylaria telfairii]
MSSLPSSKYSVPEEAKSLFQQGILHNPLLRHMPPELHELSRLVHFTGNDSPSIPVNWRWAESISSLKALEATMLNLLVTRKYGVRPVEVTINTDHASLFIMSPHLAQIVSERVGSDPSHGSINPNTLQPFRDDVERYQVESLHRMMSTNIYKTRDNRFYHIHGSLNPDITLSALELPLQGKPEDTFEQVIENIQAKVSQHDAMSLDNLINEHHRQAGTIAYSSSEYFDGEHGKQNSHLGLYEMTRDPESHQMATWWPESPSLFSSVRRPLAGLKVIDLTRVIAGPTITRSLAEMGASVMRITAPHLPDFTSVHRDLNWGKWNCYLDLNHEADKILLRKLILDADVVVDGYRPGALEKLGFGREDVYNLVKCRDRGIIHLRENCYGWYGPYAHRSGWQGISDACCGVSLAFGEAMGINEAVTPPFPNSDHCVGVIGCTGVLHALMERAATGGSYGVDTSLNYYSQWLVRSCGTYPKHVWAEVWERHGSPVFRYYDNTRRTVPAMLKLLHEHDEDVLFNPAFLHKYSAPAVGVTINRVKPVAQFEDNAIELRYNVGTRANGVDKPEWPDDLTVEVVM